jgi:hypothetical protein
MAEQDCVEFLVGHRVRPHQECLDARLEEAQTSSAGHCWTCDSHDSLPTQPRTNGITSGEHYLDHAACLADAKFPERHSA